MAYLYEACDQISDFCHRYLLRKMRRKISWTDRQFSSHFSQQLLMTWIWYLVTGFILVPHIVGSVFGPIRFLLPVCRLSWLLYTFNIMHIFRHIFLSNYWWQRSDIWSQASYRYPISWKQEVGIWRVKKRFPRYGVPIWSLWPNIRSLPSIVAEKNVTKKVHNVKCG
jgi:hypothetical protein